MTYEFIAFWLLIAIGVVRLVTIGAGKPRPREEDDDSEIWGDASLYGTESRHE